MTQIIDFTRAKLKREISASGPIGSGIGAELLDMYDAGALKIEFKEGEMMLSLTDWAQEGHDEGALAKLLSGLNEPTPEH
jgi:hypothetical protein